MAERPGERAGAGSRDRGAGAGEGSGDLLLLAGDAERSPWLDIEEEADGSAFDPRRVAIAAILGCALVVAAIAGIFWLIERRAQSQIVADGSVIEAPDGPYKTRPADPGGLEVAGTGDVSFEVAEGREHEGVFAADAFAADPDISGGSDADSDSETAGSEIAGAAVIGVQVGAFASPEAAGAGWERMRARSEVFQGRTYRIVEGSADSGPIFALQALAAGSADAARLCEAIREGGGDCQIKR